MTTINNKERIKTLASELKTASNKERIDVFVRAQNREEAKEMVTNEIVSSISNSMIKFYR